MIECRAHGHRLLARHLPLHFGRVLDLPPRGLELIGTQSSPCASIRPSCGSATPIGDSFGYADWLTCVVMIASISIRVNRPKAWPDPRELVPGERESFIGGYRWQRSGLAVGSPAVNAGVYLGVWPGADADLSRLCRSRGGLLKLSCAPGVVQRFRRVCHPAGEDASLVISSRLAARAAARSWSRSSSCSRESTTCCSSVTMRC